MDCPARCGRKRRVGQLLCRTCWHRLTPRVRSELFRTWKDAEQHLADDRRWSDYLQARRVAVHSLRTVATS